MHLKLCDIPEDAARKYNLVTKVKSDGYVYIGIMHGMYGLPQLGLLAQQLLKKRLNAEGYIKDKLVPGLWTHS